MPLLPSAAIMLFRHHARGCGQTLDISLAAPSAGTSRSPFLLSLSGGQDRPKGTKVIGRMSCPPASSAPAKPAADLICLIAYASSSRA